MNLETYNMGVKLGIKKYYSSYKPLSEQQGWCKHLASLFKGKCNKCCKLLNEQELLKREKDLIKWERIRNK